MVNASSEPGRLAVNGMSYHDRDGLNANSAVIVTVTPQDYGGTGVLAGMEFQRRLEEAAYRLGKGRIPVQLFEDFCKNRPSKGPGDILPQMKGAYAWSNVREIFPPELSLALEEGIRSFDRKIKGYSRPDALVSGVESRTLSMRGRSGLCRRYYISRHGWTKNGRSHRQKIPIFRQTTERLKKFLMG